MLTVIRRRLFIQRGLLLISGATIAPIMVIIRSRAARRCGSPGWRAA